jgi:hypothetical protein
MNLSKFQKYHLTTEMKKINKYDHWKNKASILILKKVNKLIK